MKRIGVILLILSLAGSSSWASRGGGFDRAIARALPRVVKLYGVRVGRQAGYGSGIIVSQDGLVLTVYSLLIEAKRLRAVTADGTRYAVEIVHRDRTRQLALLQLKAEDGAAGDNKTRPTFPFFDVNREVSLTPGEWVLAAGNAFKVAEGSEPVSIAHGVFSARTRLDARRRKTDFRYRGEVLVIDAITSNPGAPGGAMVNLNGEFLGMIGRQVISNFTHTHFNYAIPRDVLAEYLEDATIVGDDTVASTEARSPQAAPTGRTGASRTTHLGFRLSRVGYKRVLPFVEHVRIGSPAARMGMRRDDLILSINGRSVADVADFDKRLQRIAADDPINLVIRRGRAIINIHLEPENP